MNNNPMQIINQFSNFMRNYKGNNPREDAMRAINNSGMSQSDLNRLQEQANSIYSMAKNMGLIK